MSTPQGKGRLRHGHGSSPGKPVASRKTGDRSTPKRIKEEHESPRLGNSTPDNQIQLPIVPRISTGRAPATRPAPPTVPSQDAGPSTPSASRKRGAEPSSNDVSLARKKPVNKSTRSDLSSAEVAVSWRGKNNEVTFSSLTGQEITPSPGGLNTFSPYKAKFPASRTGKQTFTFGMSPFKRKYDENGTLTGKPAEGGLSAHPDPDSTHGEDHGTKRLFKFDFGTRAPGSTCSACGSEWHLTKDCHFPSKDGMVVICPFHDCSARAPGGDKRTVGHSLDGNSTPNPKNPNSRFHCPLVRSYITAVQAKDIERIRYMLPQMFGELVLNRKRKPSCRVLNREVCFINIAIEFSREFCQGQMPSGLKGMWPYTIRDTRDPAIRDKLQHYDELGWQRMPRGELEAKSWDQIKQEYAQGVIPPQISMTQKQRREYLAALDGPSASTTGGKEDDQRSRDMESIPQPLDENGDDRSSQEDDTVEPQSDIEALLDEVLRLSSKVDILAARVNDLEARPTVGERTTQPASMAGATYHTPIDIDMDRNSIHWCPM